MSSLADRLKQARSEEGISQSELARRVGVKPQSIQALEASEAMGSKHIVKIAEVLHVNASWLQNGEGPMREVTVNQGAQGGPLPGAASMPKDVPVMGTALGGKEGDFALNAGEIIDYVRRPPGILGNKGIFAVYLNGDSMEPWRVAGDPIYCDPHRRARPGQHVLVECKPEQEGNGEAGPAYVKRLVAQTPTLLRLAQYNPPEDNITLPLKRVKRVFRILEWAELLGL